MFLAAMCPSSGELLYQCDIWFLSLCVNDPLVCRLTCIPEGHRHRVTNQTYYWYNNSPDDGHMAAPKHVENRNKYSWKFVRRVGYLQETVPVAKTNNGNFPDMATSHTNVPNEASFTKCRWNRIVHRVSHVQLCWVIIINRIVSGFKISNTYYVRPHVLSRKCNLWITRGTVHITTLSLPYCDLPTR